jgi:hypothetical protein
MWNKTKKTYIIDDWCGVKQAKTIWWFWTYANLTNH